MRTPAAWEEITAELCELHQGRQGRVLVLRDPQHDWGRAHATLHAALGA